MDATLTKMVCIIGAIMFVLLIAIFWPEKK